MKVKKITFEVVSENIFSFLLVNNSCNSIKEFFSINEDGFYSFQENKQ